MKLSLATTVAAAMILSAAGAWAVPPDISGWFDDTGGGVYEYHFFVDNPVGGDDIDEFGVIDLPFDIIEDSSWNSLGWTNFEANNGVIYFQWMSGADPLHEDQIGEFTFQAHEGIPGTYHTLYEPVGGPKIPVDVYIDQIPEPGLIAVLGLAASSAGIFWRLRRQ